jgi:hypothetical protein
MTDDIRDQVRAIQKAMGESSGPCFLDSQLDDLSCLVRLTVEFFWFLKGVDPAPGVEDKRRYACESVFSGVDSLCRVSDAYRLMGGSRGAFLPGGAGSIESLKEEFISRYMEFLEETDFEKRCGLLLNLFKLQIVFAGMSY